MIAPYIPAHKSFSITPSLGIGYLASTLLKEKYEVEIIDCLARDINNEKLKDIIQKSQPDLIGFSVLSMFYNQTRGAIEKIRSISSAPIIVGGPHISALPEESLEELKPDFVVVGEGENTLLELANALKARTNDFESINGIYYKSNGSIHKTPARELIDDLDCIPFPAWHLMDPRSYPPIAHGTFYKRFPIAPIITTRGCPMQCSFCAAHHIWTRKLRRRSPKNVVDEIEFLHDTFGVKEFHFEDDCLTTVKKHILAICQEIVARNLDVVWACPNGVRIDSLDEEILRNMKKAGCYMMALGIESGSQELLDRAKKKLDLKLVPAVVETIKKVGIQTVGFFLLGLPGETKETIKQTVDLALDLPLDIAKFHNLIPLPQTEIFEQLSTEVKQQIDWEKYNSFDQAVCETEGLSKDEITRLQKWANKRFYLRPKTFLKTILMIKPKQYYWIAKR
ncbi:B12-binding domain-containing radical SAM protein, partial [candidate division CSSED10-310 bacterium]